MLIALWLLAFVLLALWTLLAWGTHAVLTMDANRLDGLRPLIDQVPMAAWLDTWVPGWSEALHAMIELTQVLLGWLGGVAPVFVWGIWAAGAVAWLLIFLLLSVLLVLIRREMRPQPKPAGVV